MINSEDASMINARVDRSRYPDMVYGRVVPPKEEEYSITFWL